MAINDYFEYSGVNFIIAICGAGVCLPLLWYIFAKRDTYSIKINKKKKKIISFDRATRARSYLEHCVFSFAIVARSPFPFLPHMPQSGFEEDLNLQANETYRNIRVSEREMGSQRGKKTPLTLVELTCFKSRRERRSRCKYRSRTHAHSLYAIGFLSSLFLFDLSSSFIAYAPSPSIKL